MPAQDVRLYLLQTHLPNNILQGGVLLTYKLKLPCINYCDIMGHPVLEHHQGLAHKGDHQPRLRPEEKNRLNHRLEKDPRHPRVFPFLYQDPQQISPLCLLLSEVYHQLGPVIFRGRQYSAKSLEK